MTSRAFNGGFLHRRIVFWTLGLILMLVVLLWLPLGNEALAQQPAKTPGLASNAVGQPQPSVGRSPNAPAGQAPQSTAGSPIVEPTSSRPTNRQTPQAPIRSSNASRGGPIGNPQGNPQSSWSPAPQGQDVQTTPRPVRSASPPPRQVVAGPGRSSIPVRAATGPVRIQPSRPAFQTVPGNPGQYPAVRPTGPPVKAAIPTGPPNTQKITVREPPVQHHRPVQPPGQVIRPDPAKKTVPIGSISNPPDPSGTLSPTEPPVQKESHPVVERRVEKSRVEVPPPVRPSGTPAPAPTSRVVVEPKPRVKEHKVPSVPANTSVSRRASSYTAPVQGRRAPEKAQPVSVVNGSGDALRVPDALRREPAASRTQKSPESVTGPRLRAEFEAAPPVLAYVASTLERVEQTIGHVVKNAGKLVAGVRAGITRDGKPVGDGPFYPFRDSLPENSVISGTSHPIGDGRSLLAVLSLSLLLLLSKDKYWGRLALFRPASICPSPSERPG